MKVLYVAGNAVEGNDATTEQLTRLAPDLAITTVVTAAEALAETRRGAGFLALVTSPWLAPNETLALIVSLRRDRVPIAIVPVVAESQRDFFASAVAAGADDVLLLRGDTLVRAQETLTRMRQSPHVTRVGERYRLRVLYAGRDATVWTLLEQIPFVAAERASCTPDGACLLRTANTTGSALRCDAVLVDDPEEAHPLQVLKSIKSQESDLPVVLLTPPNAGDIDTAALDLGADDAVPKNGIYRRRLTATLRRLHQRIEITTQHVALRARESRLREIVEILPQGLGVIGEDGVMLAVNGAALQFFGASRPTDVVGRDFLGFVRTDQREEVTAALRRITAGEAASLVCELDGDDHVRRGVELRGVRLERDARGGRGVLAVLQQAGQVASTANSVAPEEYQILLARLADVEGERDEWQESLQRERAAWDQAREELERRVARAEIDRTASADAEAAFVDAFTSERAAWDEARRTFEARIESQQTELETKVAGLALYAADRAAWDAAQSDFEARIEAAQAQRQADRSAIDALQRELGDAGRHHDEQRSATDVERSAWDAARGEFEQRLEALQRELRQAVDAHATERASWNARRHDLETRISEHDRARHELEERLTARANQRLELEVQLEDASRRQLELETELHRAQHDRHRTDAETAAGEQARAELGQRLDAERQEHAARLREAHDRLAALETELQHLRHAHGPILDRLRDAEAARAATAAEFEAAGRRAASLDEQLRDAHQTREQAERSRDEIAGAHADLDEQHRQLERRHRELEERHRDLEQRHRELEERYRELEHGRGQLENSHRALEASRDHLTSRLGEVDEAAAARAGALEDNLRVMRDDLTRIVEGHVAERAAWDAERHDLLADLQSRARERDDYERRLRQAEEIERERLRLEDALHAARGELAALAAAQAGERGARERGQSELDSIRQALEQERARRAVLKDRLREIGRQADERRAALEAESTTRRALEQQLADALRQIDAITGRTSEEQARLEQALTAATESRDRLIASDLFGYGVLAADGALLRCNDAFARTFGYADAGDAVARTAAAPFPPLAGRDAFAERLARDGRIDRLDARLRRVDGRYVQVIESARLTAAGSGASEIEHAIVDVSAFMTLEDRLRQSRRLEEVGTLAASMTPELIRVLGEIDRYGHLLVEAIPKTDTRRHAADALVERAAAAGELTRQLLAFSRKQVRPAETVDLHVVVARGEAVWRRLIGSHISFEMKFGARASIAPNADDLDQLITAMIVAGRDALPVGGKVVVETDRVELDATDIAGIDDATPGPRAVLAVTSSGFGVERAAMPPVASLIARRSGAFVRTHGDPGKSASLEVYFPTNDPPSYSPLPLN